MVNICRNLEEIVANCASGDICVLGNAFIWVSDLWPELDLSGKLKEK